VAHDFNNLLAVVLGNLELLRKRLPDDPRMRRLLEGAVQGAERGAALTQRLLAFARRQRLEPRPIDADGLVAGLADLIRRTMGPGIGLELRLRDGTGSVLCDPNELESALLNLCINSGDAMPEGGRLEVRATADDRHLTLSFADSGSGMSEEIKQRIFEPFFTTKGEEGSGLGLWVSDGIVRKHGGFIHLRSSTNPKHCGTVFSIFMPAIAISQQHGMTA
jgi:signal transduction histidine kinase